MIEQVDFSIIVVTYNRNKLLKECLECFKQQTYQNFEVIVIDRGSKPSAEPVVNELNDNRFLYKKSSQVIHFCDVVNEAIKDIKGKYLCIFGDDDCLHKKTLSLVAKAFQVNNDCDLVMIGSCTMMKGEKESILFPSHFSLDENFEYFQDSVKIKKFSGKEWIKYVLSAQFIGNKIECNFPTYLHPSVTFLRRGKLYNKVVSQQNGIAVKPSFDCGYIGLAHHTNIIYINAPLAVITFGLSNVSIAKRRFWDEETKDIKYMPKISQLENRGADSLLNVLHLNNIDSEYDTHVQLKLYRKILRSILEDQIWDLRTIKDLCLLFPSYFCASNIKVDVFFEYMRQIIRYLIKHNHIKKKKEINHEINNSLSAGMVCSGLNLMFETQIDFIEKELQMN